MTSVSDGGIADGSASAADGDGEGGGAELRLALVCYGGVSLAVYMHGVTKELHKLVRASRRFDELGDVDAGTAFPATERAADSERGYFEALRASARAGRRLSVDIDIIAGTSAGGINGVCLGKALARNGSQERLTRLWMVEGDLTRLLRAPRLPWWQPQALLAMLPIALRPMSARSPLRGERLSRLLYGALGAMDAPQDAAGSLIRDGGSLDLFVTTTDLHGYSVLVPTGVGGASQRDRAHAQVLRFRHRPGAPGFGPDDTAALAFSARATSCFPGAFQPVSLASFAAELGGHAPGTEGIARHFTNRYEEQGVTAGSAWFVDGGLLDNAPFDLVVKAIGERPAQTEVVRRIVYVQPDPGRPLYKPAAHDASPTTEPPGWLPSLLSVSQAAISHPVLRELLALRDMNTRIREVSALVAAQLPQVTRTIDDAWQALEDGGGTTPWQAGPDVIGRLSDALHEEARRHVGMAYESYCLLKVEEACRALADEIAERCTYPPDSDRASFVRAATSAWLRGRTDFSAAGAESLRDFLRPLDLPYRQRRLLFLLAGVNRLYQRSGRDVPRGSADRLKRRAWELLERVRGAAAAVAADMPAALTRFVSGDALDAATLLADPQDFAARYDAEFAALFRHFREHLREASGGGPLWDAYRQETSGWGAGAEDARKELLGRYLGFPLWDVLTFPVVALSRLPQFTPIGVSQFSPLAARALTPPPHEGTPHPGKLKGVALHHFGAFTSAADRENDYLWGRLDAAELILRLLHQPDASADADRTPATPAEAVERAGGRQLHTVLDAIVRSEGGLRRIGGLKRHLRSELERMREEH